MQDRLFYSPAEVAGELRVSTTTVLRLIHDGRLPALRVSERIYRIPVASFERYKTGTLEVPYSVALGPHKVRPRFGESEELPDARETDLSGSTPAGARSR